MGIKFLGALAGRFPRPDPNPQTLIEPEHPVEMQRRREELTWTIGAAGAGVGVPDRPAPRDDASQLCTWFEHKWYSQSVHPKYLRRAARGRAARARSPRLVARPRRRFRVAFMQSERCDLSSEATVKRLDTRGRRP
ncbi:hypothetical protein FI667_g7248, partial [Globisporangium splendens]